MMTGERPPEGREQSGRRGGGCVEHWEDLLCTIPYRLQNKLSLVGGHYGALMDLGRRKCDGAQP